MFIVDIYVLNISNSGGNWTQSLVPFCDSSITIITNYFSVPSSMSSVKFNFKLKLDNHK